MWLWQAQGEGLAEVEDWVDSDIPRKGQTHELLRNDLSTGLSVSLGRNTVITSLGLLQANCGERLPSGDKHTNLSPFKYIS